MLSTLTLVACLLAAPDVHRKPAPELIAMNRDYYAAVAEYASIQKDRPGAADNPHPSVTFAARIRKFVDAHRGTPDAIDALRLLLSMTNHYHTQGRMNPDAEWAVRLLTDEYAATPEIIDALDCASPPSVQVPRAMSIALYEKVLSTNTDAQARAMAKYCLAKTLLDSSAAGPGKPPPPADQERGLALLQELTTDSPATRGGQAAAEYLADRALSNAGALAPDFEAPDLAGHTIRLSQLRGRVVVLLFWGPFASGDGQRIPIPAELTARFSDKPVTFLGICADENPAKTRATLEREAVTWPNICDGATGSPISKLYHIRRWPSIFVIDQEGKIATRDPDPKKYEKTIASLLDPPSR